MTHFMNEIKSLASLLALPYFEFFACFGEFSMHPGGAQATADLLKMARVKKGEKVLEIGCGNGATTRRLVASGADVTVVDNSEMMLHATESCLKQHNLPVPTMHHTPAHRLDMLKDSSFDFVLCECVLGFVSNKLAALSEINRVLIPTSGRAGILDYHYVHAPSNELLRDLADIIGVPIEPLYAEQWRKLFEANFTITKWKDFATPQITAPSPQELRSSVKMSTILAEKHWFDDFAVEECVKHWESAEIVLNANRGLLEAHQVVLSSTLSPHSFRIRGAECDGNS